MSASPLTTFRKTLRCPSAETLLAYRGREVEPAEAVEVRTHLVDCDFCSAEFQLLHHYRFEAEDHTFAEMPVHLRLLAEDLLRTDVVPLHRLVGLARS